jgi:hypothetical protein
VQPPAASFHTFTPCNLLTLLPTCCICCPAGFTPAQAVALSNITILGGSLANFIANSSRRHPVLNRPLIDWDLILVMEPTTMLGALLGGYLNKVGGCFCGYVYISSSKAAAACGTAAGTQCKGVLLAAHSSGNWRHLRSRET